MISTANPYGNRGGVNSSRTVSGDTFGTLRRNLLDVEYAIQNQPQTIAMAKLHEAMQRLENLSNTLTGIVA